MHHTKIVSDVSVALLLKTEKVMDRKPHCNEKRANDQDQWYKIVSKHKIKTRGKNYKEGDLCYCIQRSKSFSKGADKALLILLLYLLFISKSVR